MKFVHRSKSLDHFVKTKVDAKFWKRLGQFDKLLIRRDVAMHVDIAGAEVFFILSAWANENWRATP